jgi:hypothetical protein
MWELLHEQRASQAQQVEQMEQCHAEEAKRDEGTLRQISTFRTCDLPPRQIGAHYMRRTVPVLKLVGTHSFLIDRQSINF